MCTLLSVFVFHLHPNKFCYFSKEPNRNTLIKRQICNLKRFWFYFPLHFIFRFSWTSEWRLSSSILNVGLMNKTKQSSTISLTKVTKTGRIHIFTSLISAVCNAKIGVSSLLTELSSSNKDSLDGIDDLTRVSPSTNILFNWPGNLPYIKLLF